MILDLGALSGAALLDAQCETTKAVLQALAKGAIGAVDHFPGVH